MAGAGRVAEELFTTTMRMRARTKSIHAASDALVNAKLGVTMSDDSVWAEGLFGHIYY
jgi:hypothetical protein